MNVLELARESGLTVLLDGRIGRQEYTSVSGSADALFRFTKIVLIASRRERKRYRRHSSLSRPVRRVQRFSIGLPFQDEIARTARDKRCRAAHSPKTTRNRIESPLRSLRPALCR